MQHAEKERRPLLPLDAARANREPLDLRRAAGARRSPGTRSVEPALDELRAIIDWQFFFHAWELKGKFPAILEQPAARELYDDANDAARRDRPRRPRSRAEGVYGFWPAHAEGDDIVLASGDALPDAAPAVGLGRLAPEPLAGRLRRRPAAITSARSRSAIHGADELAARYEAEHDDYRAIMVKALADRLAEAFAEYLHLQARREWYEPDAAPTSEELIAESYRGIRPGVRLPGLPRPLREAHAVRPARRRLGRASS